MGIDQFSLDVMRGRDMGNAPFYKYFETCQQTKVTTWADVAVNFSPENLATLKDMYSSVMDVDLIVGALMEKQQYMNVGAVSRCIMAEQFLRLKNGDRYFYNHKQRPSGYSRSEYY